VVLQRWREKIIFKQQREIMPIQNKRDNSILTGAFIFIFCVSSFCAPSFYHKISSNVSKGGVADTSKVVVSESYWDGEEKKSALFDSSGRQLSTQQMVDFLKNELFRLNGQINAIVHKSTPDSKGNYGVDEVDAMKLAIIKGKLESMEKMLDEWTKQRDWEISDPGEIQTSTLQKDARSPKKK
jgi:hypothetical protein